MADADDFLRAWHRVVSKRDMNAIDALRDAVAPQMTEYLARSRSPRA